MLCAPADPLEAVNYQPIIHENVDPLIRFLTWVSPPESLATQIPRLLIESVLGRRSPLERLPGPSSIVPGHAHLIYLIWSDDATTVVPRGPPPR
jgi:hypothetical protein